MALASLLRIPVAMRNVADEQIFRPSAWGFFGAQDPQAPITAPARTLARSTRKRNQAFRLSK